MDEGSSACLCGGFLGALDPDSPPDHLTFHLEALPLYGFLENTLPTPGSEKSNAGVRVGQCVLGGGERGGESVGDRHLIAFCFPESFSLNHMTSGFINYVQSEHEGVEPSVDQLSLSVSDGLHRSAPLTFYILISPTNDETPSLLGANFTVRTPQRSEVM